MKKNVKFIIAGIVAVIIILLVLFFVFFNGSKSAKKIIEKVTKKDDSVEVSTTRPYAVMINNIKVARPHAGLNKAKIVYEFEVEGGITRMLAIFQDAKVDKIGSIRSARPYYLDYVMENDAIFIHWGGSQYAYNDISSLKIEDIDGMVYGTTYFYKDKTLNRSTEHTAFTTTEMLEKAVAKKGFRTTTEVSLLKYTKGDIKLNEKEGVQEANSVSIVYSNTQTSEYTYNETTKLYEKSMNGVKNTDLVTGETYTAKNILVYGVSTSIYDGKYVKYENIGSGEGYYITEGFAIPMKWSKESRSAKTKYTYTDGKEITFNDGETYIHMYSSNKGETIIK